MEIQAPLLKFLDSADIPFLYCTDPQLSGAPLPCAAGYLVAGAVTLLLMCDCSWTSNSVLAG